MTRQSTARIERKRRVHQPLGSTLDKERSSGLQRRAVDRFNAAAIQLVAGVPAETLLDVACGDGWLTSLVAQQRSRVACVGVDRASDELAERWRGRPQENLRFEVADLHDLPFPDRHFDVVTMFEALEHCPDPDAAIRESLRVSDRWLVFSVPWEPIWRIANVARGAHLRHLGNTPGHVNHWTRRGFEKLLAAHGRVDLVRTCTPWTLARIERASGA